MRCPYCETSNDEAAESCRKCGHELPQDHSPWLGPAESADKPSSNVQAAYDQWDPARRHSQPRSMSAFVPPARFPEHLGWAIICIVLCSLVPAVFAFLLWNARIAGVVLLTLPIAVLALVFSLVVRREHTVGDEARAFRYSQLAKLFCWISMVLGFAFYVGVFMRLMYGIGKYWGY
jgi:hypothetical protein